MKVKEPCLFFKKNCIVSLHVDDTLSTGEPIAVEEFRKRLREKFKSGKGGLAQYYLAVLTY